MENIIDIQDFNDRYLAALKNSGLSNKFATSSLLNVESSQLEEIMRMPPDKSFAISQSPVAIVESVVTLADLMRCTPTQNIDSVVAELNGSFLALIRFLTIKDARLAFLAARVPINISNAVSQMSRKELLKVAKSNRLLFKCALPTKALVKANKAGDKFNDSYNFLHHVPLLSQVAR